MKSFMNTMEFVKYFKDKFPDYAQYTKNGYIDKNAEKSIGIYLSTPREKPTIALGGIENTISAIIPINILIHWTESAEECSNVANSIYTNFFGLSNVIYDKRKISSIMPIDGSPVDVGRNEKNFCELVIRLDVTYYLEEEIV